MQDLNIQDPQIYSSKSEGCMVYQFEYEHWGKMVVVKVYEFKDGLKYQSTDKASGRKLRMMYGKAAQKQAKQYIEAVKAALK